MGAKSLSLLLLCALLGTQAFGQETGAYPNGTSGLKAGTVPPPGHYYLMYNRYYRATRYKTIEGETETAPDGGPYGLSIDVFANVHRFIHITDYKIFGADYGWNIVLPVISNDLRIDSVGVSDNEFKIGDMNMEPFVIEWHEDRYDFGYVYGVFFPTASRSMQRPALPGKDFWTHYFGVAGTYYFDEEKTWTLSFLSRYEMHSRRADIDYHPGDDLSFEWGFGKTIDELLTLGVSGYCAWQVTEDHGSAVDDPQAKDRVFGIGPEIQYFSPDYNFGYHFRFWWEFGARDRSEGTIATLTFVKPF